MDFNLCPAGNEIKARIAQANNKKAGALEDLHNANHSRPFEERMDRHLQLIANANDLFKELDRHIGTCVLCTEKLKKDYSITGE